MSIPQTLKDSINLILHRYEKEVETDNGTEYTIVSEDFSSVAIVLATFMKETAGKLLEEAVDTELNEEWSDDHINFAIAVLYKFKELLV